MARETSLYRMNDQILDGKMRQIVRKARKAGRTWIEISVDLQARGCVVSHESLRSWFRDEVQEPDETPTAKAS